LNPGKLELVIHKPIPSDEINEDSIPDIINKTKEIIYSGLWDKYKDKDEKE
jgi:1-acyl-sn-glycerol-3-phosphate acyltransferase